VAKGAIIAALIAMFTVIVSPFVTSLLNKPDLYADLYPSSKEVRIQVGNTGSAPATNVIFYINSTVPISNVTNLDTTNDLVIRDGGVALKQYKTISVDKKFIELSVPRIVQGYGSYIELKMSFNKPVNTNSIIINVDIVSDQGSITATDINHRSLFLKAIVFYQNYSDRVQFGVFIFMICFVIEYFVYRRIRKPRVSRESLYWN
jgi:hypothetical protein